MVTEKANITNYSPRNWDCSDPKAVIVLVHGLGEHSGRYQAIGNYFIENGYALMSIDLPGHGKSSGKRGHIDNFSDFTTAIEHLHSLAKNKHPDKPIFLLGHSLGGLISTLLLLDKQHLFSGALLSGAAIQTPNEPSQWQIKIFTMISLLAPKMGLIKLAFSGISRDENEIQKYERDPLVNKGKLSARLLVEMFNTMRICKRRAYEITLPIKIMHGSADTMTAPAGSQYLYDQITSSDKTLNIYKGLYHEIFNEPEANKIYAEIIDWLNKRV